MNFDYRTIAKNVLKLASELDTRMAMPASDADKKSKIDAWETILTGQVWPTEAEAAVIEHYRDPRAFPLMPGDVVAHCKAQPVWSSLEHARDWILRFGVQNPYSGAIEAYSGIPEPVIDIPESVPRSSHKAYLAEHLRQWVAPRLDDLAAAILAKKFRPWWADQ
ncbi:hypothetical protein [Mycolicibacterium mageritense]|uniref:Uncharacterized protein n=1 Tax=Mycolicibacterium mageritense TaxID=53462 RepID=A0AAI8XQY4_MYCME|nr:hypothetical protein [Mycolicibacterium mageritense]BDY31393.1 hypothetical protein hbim_05345 [Mycolicibacterium mageritense]